MRPSRWCLLGTLLRGATVALVLLAATAAHAATQDITSQFAITSSGFVLNRATNTFDTTITLRNTSSSVVAAPIAAVVGGLTPSVTLANVTGQTATGDPFVSPMPSGSLLQPGGTLSFVLKFANPQRLTINLALQILYSRDLPTDAPNLLRVVATGGTNAFLIGRLDSAPNLPIALQVLSAPSCSGGLLVGGTAVGGTTFAATTDKDGYFSLPVAGINPGAFVAVKLTAPTTTATSACLVSSTDNDAWPKAFLLDGNAASARDFIDAPGKARWYRFSVIPGQRIQVTLSGLPADYDLAVFKDIGQAFHAQFNPANASAADLVKLTAEFAPSIFSPSIFSPSIFSPSIFSPSIFSPSIFSPSIFSPSIFSPSIFSPSIFSPSIFSPSIFSPSIFSPSIFSPSIFSSQELAQAFSTAQTRSIIAVSATPGTSDESAVVNSWNNTGSFYIRVTGRGAAFDTTTPFLVSIAKGPTTCTGVTDFTLTPRAAVAPAGLKTVIVTDSSRVALDAALPEPGNVTLRNKLSAFAQRAEIAGVVVDVAADARVGALKKQAADNPACPFAKNLVAEEIKGIVDSYRGNPLRYVVIVGNDDAIPFFRSPDQSGLGEESGYVPPVQSNSPSEASLRLDFVLSQDAYGAATRIALSTSDFPVPGLAVGRLVESADEIAGLLNAYISTNGVVSPKSSLVTGYDFLADAATAVTSELQQGTGVNPETLITPNGVSPQDPSSWTAAQLGDKLLGSRHDVIFLAGHFSANSALAADFSTSLLTTDLAASPVNLTNSIVFSAGCHSGYNLVDTDAIAGVTLPLDWAQAFAQKRATLIAGTGYQYGDTDFMEYSERLYDNFARQLRAGTGAVSVGEALVKAKLDYLATTPDIRGIHEKALLEATLFGLPMLGVNMPSGRGAGSGNGGVITPTLVASGPAHDLGLKIQDLSIAPSFTAHSAVLKNVQGGPDVTATWLSGPDGVVTKPGEPALPLIAANVTPTDASIVLRGIGFRGGTYADTSPMFPFSGAPTTELRGVHVPFASPTFYPARMWTPNYFGALAGNGGTDLLVTPVQHRAANIQDGTSTQRRFTGLDVRLYYSGNLSQAALSDAPSIVSVDAQPDGGGALFTAQVVGDPAAAIHQVWITFTSDGGNAWTSLDLGQCVAPLPAACGTTADSRLWKGRLPTAPTNLKFVVQAASGVGLVALDDNRGAYYALAGAAPPAATTLTLVSSPSAATFGDSFAITASLTSAGAPVAGEVVTIMVGGAAQIGVTGSDGRVTINVPVAAAPGNYQIVASFSGDEASQSSSAAGAFVVAKAPSNLAALAPAGATLTGTLSGTASPLAQESIGFAVTGPGGARTIFAITDYLGRATLPPPGLPAGTYTVTQVSYVGNDTYAATSTALAQQFVVAKAPQGITFDPLAGKTQGDPDFPVFASASSGLPVTFAASGACTLLGNTVHITGTGSCTLTANQGGDTNFNPALPVQQSFTIVASATGPTVVSLVRALPSPTMADVVTYTVTFSEPVTGVAPANFNVVASGIAGASVATISGTGATRSVTVNTGRGTGSLHLDVVNGTGITNGGGSALTGTPVVGETYQIDKGGTVIGTGGAGQPVASFGTSGYALFSDVPTVHAPNVMAVLADGRILAAGAIGCDANATTNCTLQLGQFLANGAPDPSFGTNGRVVTTLTNINPELSALIVNASDGTFFVNGSRNNGTAEVPIVAKFTPAGLPVTAFGTNGVASLNGLPMGLGISGSAIDGSGRIVIAGTTPDAGPERNDVFVTRLTAAGAIDPTFGAGGVAQFALSTVDARSDGGTAVVVQPDGKIVVGGRTQVTAGLGYDFLLLRLDASGALDPAFGTGGIATTRFASSTGPNLGRKLVLQPDGAIVLVGGVTSGTATQCGIARFNANGTLDPAFGTGGRVLESITVGCFNVSLQADGKLVIVGNDQVADVEYGTFLRLLATGAPDGVFGTGGFVDISNFDTPGRVAFTSTGNLVTSLVIQDPADGVVKAYVVELIGLPPASNQPPVANAGPDQTILAGSTVQLTSAGSSDPEGSALAYAWTFVSRPGGSTAHFSNSTAANPTFVADIKGTYVIQLVVTDAGLLSSAPATVQITATNRAPVAVADSYSVGQGATLTVNAATGVLANDSDADGDALTAALVTGVAHGSLTLNADGSFTYAPNAGYSGPDSFTYRANDGTSDSNTATVSLTVVAGVNHPPVANAGTNQNATVGQVVQLGGTCTDADGDATTPTWSFTSRPATSTATLSNATILNPTFTPDLAGSYQLQLVCNDGHVDSAPSTVTIQAGASASIALALANPGLIGLGQTANVLVTLSAPAPAGGVVVTLSSDDLAVAGVTTATVTVAATQTQATAAVNGVGSGSTTLRASAPAFSPGTLPVAVTANVLTAGYPGILNVPLGATATVQIFISPAAPAGGLLVSLSTDNPGIAVPGVSTVTVPAGQSSVAVTIIGVATGTTTGRASASGYAGVQGTINTVGTLAPVQWTVANGGNDHWYQFVFNQGGFTWEDARLAATNANFQGVQGYLATVTSLAENNFLYALSKYPNGATGTTFDPANPNVSLGTTSIAGLDASTWLGGSDAATEGTWRWMNGPEAANVFWTGDATGSAPPGAFAWWDNPSTPGGTGGTEPNNQTNEDFLQLRYSGGLWNDSTSSVSGVLPGFNADGVTRTRVPSAFLVEYGPAGAPLTVTVTNLNDSGLGSLRDAVTQANQQPGPNTIVFAPGLTGTITLTSQIQIAGPMTIVGPGADQVTIDANANSRVFSIFLTDPACPSIDGPDYLVSISGLTLANAHNGVANTGGAIFTEHSLLLDSMIIRNSVSRQGAGVGVLVQYPGQTLAITNSQLVNNVTIPIVVNVPVLSNQQGAGLYVVERCSGMRTMPMTVTIAGSVFTGNRSQPTTLSGLGAAITVFSQADVAITDSRIVDNHVDTPNPPVANQIYRGGGIYGNPKSLTIVRTEIAENSVIDATASDQSRGGGLGLFQTTADLQSPASAMAVSIVDSTISNNAVPATAGAMWVFGNVAVEIDNSTLAGNIAGASRTGGILLTTGATSPATANNAAAPTLKVVSSIIADSAATTADIATNTAVIPAFTINATSSLLESICSTCNISVAGAGNLAATDPQLGPLAFNGGTSRTQALLPGSPAIDAGSNPLALATDQRGTGFARIAGNAADMGAYESTAVANHAPVANAGPDQSVTVAAPVQLSGACSDVDGDATTAIWSFTSKPATSTATLSSATILNPTFTPDLAGSYRLQLVCNDGHVDSSPSPIVITAASPTIAVTLASPLAAVNQVIAATVTLSVAAPAGGLSVTPATSDASVAAVSSAFVVAAGNTTGSFSVTGVAPGSATISASASGYSPGSAGIGVTSNAITVGGPVNVQPGSSAALPITINPAAPAGGLLVTLSSNDTSIATPAAPTITIPAGQSTGNATVNGVGIGTTTILAQAQGYASGTGTVITGVPTTLTVTNLNDSGPGSLRDTIALAGLAPDANTVVFAPGLTGTIALTSGQIRIDTPMTIAGPGSGVLAVDGNLNGRVFTIIENNAPACPALSGPSDFLVTISGLTLKNGSRNVVDSGGGALQSSKSLVLDSVVIRDSQAKGGGGLVFNAQYPGQTLTINNSQFINNVAKPVVAGDTGSHNGGAVLIVNYCPQTPIAAIATISGSVFTGNRVQPVALEGRGGAIAAYLSTGAITISNTRIVGNAVEPPVPPVAGSNYPGGGVNTATKSVLIQGSEIAENSADYGGGINIAADDPDLQAPADAFAFLLENSTVSGNVANQNGGGIDIYANVTAVIANATVNGNSAPAGRAGGVRIASGATFPVSSINTTPPTLSIVSSILANNTVADIGGLPSANIPSPYTLGATNSLFELPPSADFLVTGAGNLIGVDPQVVALAFNGGPTRTHALQPGSPAIDTGSNVLGLTTDQRGAGFPRVAGVAADIGAYEAPASTNHPPVANAGPNQNAIAGQQIQLAGACTDADGDTTTPAWSFTAKPAGSTAALSSVAILNPTFTADMPGTYQLQLVCNDGHVNGSPSTVTITVAPNAIILTLGSPLVGVGRTLNGTITLPQAAPAGGSTVALSSANTSIATIAPPSVAIPAGATIGSFSVTGVALGGPVTLTGSAAGFNTGTTSITVTNTLISLGALPTMGLGQSVSLPISLTAPAPAGGVTVNFSSGDTAIATVTASVFIAGGQTVPGANPQVSGVNIGTAQINAVAPGFAPDTRAANVQVNVTFTPTALSVVQNSSQNITVNISAPAPAGGLSVALTTANAAIATAASPVTIPAGQLTVPAAITGVAVGSTTLQATGSGVSSGTATINVTAAPAINLGNLTIGKDLQTQPSLSLGAAAPAGGLVVTLTSLDTSKVLLSNSATAVGSGSITVTIPTGQSSTNAFFVQALSDTGTATVTASAPGFATDTSTVTLAPSGFYNSSPGGAFTTTTFSTNTLFRVAPARLSATGVVQAGQALRAGIAPVSVPVTVADVSGTNVGSITVSPVVFNGNDSFVDTAFHPLSAGTAQITVGVPAGFATPQASQRQITATVTAPAINLGNLTIGKDLQTQPSLSLGAAAPAGGLVVTLTSLDTSKVLLSNSATVAGSGSITVTIAAGQSSTNAFFVQALSDTGTATVTVSAPGFATDTSTVTLAPSGFYNSSPGGAFTTTTFSTNTLFRVAPARLSATGVVQAGQALRAGIAPVSVPVTVADVSGTNVGSITVSPVVFNGNDSFVDTAFHPLSAGTAQITVGVPAGFATPQASQRQITATVTAPAISLGNVTIGKDLQTQPSLSLGAAAPAGGLVVTLTSLDTSKVLLSNSATVAGSGSITVTIAAGQSSTNAFFVQALSDTGTATVTVSAPGFATDTSTVTLAPSGFYNSSPGGAFTTTTFSTSTLFRVQPARLSATGVVQAGQALRAGIAPVSVPVTVADVSGTNVGSITVSPLVFNGGDTFKDTAFDPLSAGTAQITVGVPAGFATPQASDRQITATVTAPGINSGNVLVGRDLQAAVSVTLGATPPSPINVTVTIASGSIASVSNSPTSLGGTTLTFTNVTTTSVGTFNVHGLALGSTLITVQAPGYSDDTSTLTVQPSGFANSSPGGNFSTTTLSGNTLFRVQPARLDPTTLNVAAFQSLRAGLTASVTVTSSDTNVGTITTSPVAFAGGDSFKDSAFDPLSTGSTVLTVGVPAGFDTPSNSRQITATVNLPALSLGDQTIGKDLQVQPSLTLGAQAPAGGLQVTLTSLDPSKVLLSTTAAGAGTNTITVTVAAGQSSTSAFFIQGLDNTGTATVMATAAGFGTDQSTISLVPSGFGNTSPGADFSTTTTSGNILYRVQPARLDPTTLNVAAFQSLRGGAGPVSVPVTSSNSAVGVITVSPLSFLGGDAFKDTAFDSIAAGTTVLTVGVPAGFSTPSNSRAITATVN